MILQALNCLCPSLDTVLSTEQLAEMTNLLEAESKNSFSSWVSEQLKLFSLSLAFVTTDTPLSVLPSWDKVAIEETGDSGEQVSRASCVAVNSLYLICQVSSIILIPPSPSLSAKVYCTSEPQDCVQNSHLSRRVSAWKLTSSQHQNPGDEFNF